MSVSQASSFRKDFPFPKPSARSPRALCLATSQVSGDASAGSATVSHDFPNVNEGVQVITVSGIVTGVNSAEMLFQIFTGDGAVSSQGEVWTQSAVATGNAAFASSGVGAVWSLPQFAFQLSPDIGTAQIRLITANPGAGGLVRLVARYLTYQRNVAHYVPFGTQNVPITSS